jgi:hypothetical protein
MRVSVLLVLFPALVLAGCGDDSPTAPASARLRIEMTDAPADQLSEIQVFVAGLKIKRSGDPEARVANEIGLVELLALEGTSQLLAAVEVEPGSYVHIMVELDQEASYVREIAGAVRKPLQIASEEVKVLGGFEVAEGSETTVLLDFDAEQSVRQTGSGDWLMVPVIVQANVSRE